VCLSVCGGFRKRTRVCELVCGNEGILVGGCYFGTYEPFFGEENLWKVLLLGTC
jgi:hypothetical protein